MPDNYQLIRERLGEIGASPRREQEIIRELGEHLDDLAEALMAGGAERIDVQRDVAGAVTDWPALRDAIRLAETEEAGMNYHLNHRSKALWLPALFAVTLSHGLLLTMQCVGVRPRFYWLGSEMTGSMYPYFMFVFPWLVSQPLVGAITSYWSRRAGGQLRHQLLAALAPAMSLLFLFLLFLPLSLILTLAFERPLIGLRLIAFAVFVATWVLCPSVPLLAGAAPFLRRTQSRS
jgi:hypothetical protein